MKTLVIGASPKSWRYAYQAVIQLTHHGHEVIALGKTPGKIDGIPIHTSWPEHLQEVHTITLYLREIWQSDLAEKLVALAPARVIFNPGAENQTLSAQLRKHGIETINACTLVMLNTGQYA